MTNETSSKENLLKKGLPVGALIVLVLGIGVFFLLKQTPDTEEPASPQKAVLEDAAQPVSPVVIDYNKISGDKEENDPDLAQLMDERKAKYGVNESLDMIVKGDESIKVGEHTLSMKEILAHVAVSRGEIVETELTPPKPSTPLLDKTPKPAADKAVSIANSTLPPVQSLDQDDIPTHLTTKDAVPTPEPAPDLPDRQIEEFGIYVVRAGDNIWNIHFRVLKDYFDHEGVVLSPRADEPNNGGYSSGVGKILKFSENMVAIYNLKSRRVDQDLNLIYPLSKVVIYNMTHVIDLLQKIDYSRVNMIQFDGDALWLPAQQ